MGRPDFFIVGAPKCGTTAMQKYLRQHPEIFMPERMEMHFFGSDLRLNRGTVRQKAEYLSFFSSATAEKRVGEKSVWYLYSTRAAEEIREFSPTARIVIMLRNPVDMLYSLHSQFLYNGNEDIEDFRLALDAEEDRKRGRRIPGTVIHVPGLFYRETVKFADQVRRYFDAFGRENVNSVIFDDFKDDPAGVYDQMLRFLDVAGGFRPTFGLVNPNKRVRSRVVRRFLGEPPDILRRAGRAMLPSGLRESLSRFVVNVGRRANTRYERRMPMGAELRSRLLKELAPEVARLSEVLGRDLMHWCKE